MDSKRARRVLANRQVRLVTGLTNQLCPASNELVEKCHQPFVQFMSQLAAMGEEQARHVSEDHQNPWFMDSYSSAQVMSSAIALVLRW